MKASLTLACLLVAGCGAASFAPRFEAPVAPTEQAVAEAVSVAQPREERPVIVGITADGAHLCAWDIDRGLLWKQPIQAKSAPLAVGDSVVIQEDQGIMVRDLATGAVRTMVDDEGRLIGADAMGHAVVLTVTYDEVAPRSTIALVDGSGVRFRRALNQPAGTPALTGSYVVVPWGTQRLSVLDADDGTEIARWSFTNMALGHALVDRGRVYVGQHGLLRVDRTLPDRRDGDVQLSAPLKRALPGQPPLLPDGYAPVPEPENASHRLRAEWRVGVQDGTLENELLVLRFHRVVFGFEAGSDELRFVRAFERDLVGAAMQPGYVMLVDEAGQLRVLDSSGALRLERALGEPVRVAAVRPGTWTLPAQAADAKAPAASSLHDQLLEVARLPDDRIGAARAYAIERLSKLKDATVTSELIALCSDETSPDMVSLSACRGLAQRDTGAREVLEALQRRASFLDGTPEPPVGALAQAASNMGLRQAAPWLLSHADDPHTPAADLAVVFQALGKLEHRPATPMLERFVRLHHAEPAGSELSPALYAALDALGHLRARSARATLEDVVDDGLTLEPVRKKAGETLGVVDSPPGASAAPPAQPSPEPVEERVQTDPRPYSLDANAIRTVLGPHEKRLARCLSSDPAKPHSARVSMIITGEGAVQGMMVTPTSVEPCVEPVLRAIRFPATRLGRQHITHVIAVAERPEPAPIAQPKPAANAQPKPKPAAAKSQ